MRKRNNIFTINKFKKTYAHAKLNTCVCIITFPLSLAGYIPLSNLVNLLHDIFDKVYIVSGGAALEKLKKEKNIWAFKVTHRTSSNLFMRLINSVGTQLKILRYVAEISKNVDLFIFSIGGDGLFVPLLILRLLRKNVILMPGGISTKVYSIKKDPLSKLLMVLDSLTFSLADRLIIYSRGMIQEANLGKYQHKIIIAHEHFVDLTKFTAFKKFYERLKLVGYIGRLSEEKGVLNLIEAMPLVLKKGEDIHFVIYGDGILAAEIKKTIKTKDLEAYVKLTGWISHEDVPQYLNEFRLLVLTSFTEGLPNIMLEAMACGTPVLATPVGAITDIIMEGRTGFLLKSNDPKHIAERIVELLDKPEILEKISINAYWYIKENFSYEKTLTAWQKIFSELGVS